MSIIQLTKNWLADNFKGFQYPSINKVENKPEWEAKRGSLFIEVDKNSSQARIGFEGKIILFCFSIVALLIGIVLIGGGLIFLWALITSL